MGSFCFSTQPIKITLDGKFLNEMNLILQWKVAPIWKKINQNITI